MIGYQCGGCGQTWPENYCPTCCATIDRGQLPPPLASPMPIVQTVSAAAGARPRDLTTDWPGPSRASERTASATGSGTGVAFTFTGTASEYFRIWIVNVALTVLTVGIYAAWAKVRKRRYFWSCTQLGGRPFEYTGDPIAILKGNLIFAAGAIGYYFVAPLHPLLGLAVPAAVSLVYPWLFQKAMRFNAHHTRHRNIRFGFRGRVGESYAINLGLLLFVPLTLGMIWPYIQYRKKRFQLENLSFGTAPFEFSGESGPFFGWFFASLGFVVLGILAGFACGAFAGVAMHQGGEDQSRIPTLIGLGVMYAWAAATYLSYYATRVSNYVIEHTTIKGVASLRSWQSASDVFGLELVNLLAVVGSLGLAIPWAAMRRARYRWTHVEARFTGPVERVTAAVAADPGTLGDVAADQFDIDISL